ncbi:hypothetical protein WSM22_27180 [Cytophagales bacterium WSM2-2]|nr:hypothetical protein WSM22_27180 [Cytophagales bacterium WSM2-2]
MKGLAVFVAMLFANQPFEVNEKDNLMISIRSEYRLRDKTSKLISEMNYVVHDQGND